MYRGSYEGGGRRKNGRLQSPHFQTKWAVAFLPPETSCSSYAEVRFRVSNDPGTRRTSGSQEDGCGEGN
jgi:hypothetical protein